MSSTDSAFVDPADTPADLADFLDAVGHEPLTARMNHATWQITRDGDRYAVECVGAGGGWYASRSMSRRELLAYLKAQDSLELKRPESQRP
ncbi:hypothetical protein PM085_15745 [Halorubrum ezzemoulense]|uniref:Uncharacterized protein n=1 Tax=Halorubrum ezzemoulense TaxID=337243 RepID=A0ABT4Z8A8_HALEZ|nr:hypothetical protein [Halorubrum ezzemoulense]MDB2293710.1 hypothetical protein [Halorubrum ezzemoulense]